MPETRVLGLLQNIWVYKGTTARKLESAGLVIRINFVRTYMPATTTGRRLQRAFGTEFDRIIWENAAKDVATRSSGSPRGCQDHVRNLIEHVDPDVILTFGRTAFKTLQGIWDGPKICGPHPAARRKDTFSGLERMAERLRAMRVKAERTE